jgi:membrane dipeptidase
MATRRLALTEVLLMMLISILPAEAQNSARLSDQQLLERARALHQKIITVDTHCDTAMRFVRGNWNPAERHDPDSPGAGKIDLPRMKEGGLDAEFFAAFVSQEPRTPEGYQAARQIADNLILAVKEMVATNTQVIGLAFSPEDAKKFKKQGKLTAFLGIENGYAIGQDLSLIKHFYEEGVRYITLCHTSDNDICDSSTDRNDPEDRGLSQFGRQVVAECNRLGMIVDISHASDRSFWDVLASSQAPIIASHSCVRAVCDNPRNLTDDMIKALAAKGGVIQICFLSAYVKKPKPNPDRDQAFQEFRAKYGNWRDIKDEAQREKIMAEMQELNRKYPVELATVQDLVDHIDHVVKLVGVDYVGVGTDFDGGGGVSGCNDVSQMINVTVELMKRGYSDQDLAKIWGQNFFRVFNQVNETAKRLNKTQR